MTTLEQRWESVEESVEEACAAAGRARSDVRVIGVSKTVGLDAVAEAIEVGIHDFGENRPDELVRKHDTFPSENWHFIGNIQSRRIPDIVSASTLIHSVCKEAHLSKIDSAAEKIGKCQRLLLEVNVSGEESKSGFSPDEVEGILERAVGLSHISIEGLMTMAPQGKEEAIVATFSGLERLRDNLQVRLQNKGISCHLSALSMGMTEDWRSAVGFGTTIVRVGRAIFSDEFE